MTGIRGFDPKRFFLLIRNEVLMNKTGFLIFSAVVWGILLFNLVFGMGSSNDVQRYGGSYSLFLFVSAFSIFEKGFKGVHNETWGMAWLTLPASMFEKYTSRLALSITGATVGIMILFFLFTAISEVVFLLLAGSFNASAIFNPFDRDILLKTLQCLILVSPFHLGVIYFRKNAFLKTFLTLLVYLLSLCLIYIMALEIFLSGPVDFSPINRSVRILPNLFMGNDSMVQVFSIAKWTARIFWYLLAPLCWVIAYIRLTEKEV